MFDLKKPCSSCPFVRGNGERYGLSDDRLEEIFDAPAFQCHKTVVYGEDENGCSTHDQGANPQQCKGLMSLLAHEERPNAIMQVAERLGHCSVESHKVENSYQSFEECREDHAKNATA